MTTPFIYNAAMDFIDRNIDEGRAEKICFIDPDSKLTYGELQARAGQMGNLLNALGLERESRIALLALDTIDWPIVFWGAIRAGVIPVALNTLLAAEHYQYMLEDSRAKALFVSAPLLEVVRPVLDQLTFLEHVVVIGGEVGKEMNLHEELASQSVEFQTASTYADEVAFWLYSSGSTGMPKGVQHVHSSLMDTARTFGQGVMNIKEQDVVLSAAKLFFAYGLGNAMSFPMSVGATTVLWPARPTPQDMFHLMSKHQPTIFYGVPTLYAAMLAHPQCGRDISSEKLRLGVSAGEALPAEIGKRWKEIFGVDIIDGVGSTEMLHIFLSNRPGDVVYGTSGVAVPEYGLRLVNENGEEVKRDEIGELLVRGESAALGYWNQRTKSRQTFEGEWTRTGDKYTRDADGRYIYCGRTDDMFKVSGIWVSPFEVESALMTHPSVLESAVVAYEDQDRLTKPKAYVVLNKNFEDSQGELAQDLREHVKDSVGKWKYPRQIEFVEDLPKTATGKVQRFKLREDN